MMMKIPQRVWMPSLIKYRHADGDLDTYSHLLISAVSMQKSSINAQKHGIFFRVLPVSTSVYGKPVITMPKNATRAGIPVRNRY